MNAGFYRRPGIAALVQRKTHQNCYFHHKQAGKNGGIPRQKMLRENGGFSRHDERSKNTKCQSALTFVSPPLGSATGGYIAKLQRN